MGKMKDLYIKLHEGDELNEAERAFVHNTVNDQEWDEYYSKFLDENEKVKRD